MHRTEQDHVPGSKEVAIWREVVNRVSRLLYGYSNLGSCQTLYEVSTGPECSARLIKDQTGEFQGIFFYRKTGRGTAAVSKRPFSCSDCVCCPWQAKEIQLAGGIPKVMGAQPPDLAFTVEDAVRAHVRSPPPLGFSDDTG